jgi:Tol biopolymer transport system component
VVFCSNENRPYPDIFIIDVDGHNKKRLTDTSAWERHPVFSPDGQKIVFATGRYGNPPKPLRQGGRDAGEILIMNTDGTHQQRLTTNQVFDGDPCWSLDGSKIAFSSERDGNEEIYLMNPDGTEPINLTDNPAEDSQPAWSPNGRKLAFVSKRDGNREIYVMSVDGGNPKRLTKQPTSDDRHPIWLPDGSKILFVSTRDGNAEIYSMNVDGSEQENLTNNPDEDHLGSCSAFVPEQLMNQTALSVAKERGYSEITELLEKHGAKE